MELKSIDASLLSKMFLAGAKNLESQKEYINELNVFPVPDGDTGTNMTMTIISAAGEVSSLDNPSMATLAKAISSGSLRGARGNSGVILSQLLRGFSKTIAEYDELNVSIVADSFERAVETAYKAVMKPKEGTILTVARRTYEKAAAMALETDDFTVFGEAVLEEAQAALDETPELLPVLKEAGVVDSGGTGLLEFLRGCYDVVLGKEIDYSSIAPKSSGKPMKITAETEAEIKFGYCTEFIVVLNEPVPSDEQMSFRDYLETLGDSIVFVADDEIIKVHVHTNDPGLAIQRALTYGSLSKIKIDNMREEHQEKLFKDSLKLAEQQAAEKEAEKEEKSEEKADFKDFGFVTVSIGDGLNSIFKDLGADEVIAGGQTMNPSTDDILQAVNKINAGTVFILPNNKNIVMAANQVVDLAEGKEVIVIPTSTVPQGIAALIGFIPEASAEENKEAMLEAISVVKTGQLTYAVRNTTIDGMEINEGDYMAVGDKSILAVGKDIRQVICDMMDEMVDDDSEIISIYYGDEVNEDDASSVEKMISEKYPECEVELHEGGQPIYYYVISVE
ncbi:MAG: DAK2 domain-containing protein [Eubacterium sp.]|nr:DAK2 domain-containing protein [Eubacterium sp.]